jgi:hypothetical protein
LSSSSAVAPGTPPSIVYPADCAFAVTVPTTQREFVSDLHDERKDFVRGFFADSPLADEDKWRLYQPRANAMNRLLARLQQQRVTVVRRATLADWRDVQRTTAVAILFSHWRSGLLHAGDICWTTLRRLMTGIPRVGDTPESRIAAASDGEHEADEAQIVDRLNHILLTRTLGEHPWLTSRPEIIAASAEHRVYMNRRFLAQSFPGAFRGDTSVEFADGLRCLDDVAAVTEPGFTGVIDLSVCNSVLLAEMIKQRAPRCLVVTTQTPAVMEYRVTFYGAVFERLRKGRPYIATLTELRRRLIRRSRRS